VKSRANYAEPSPELRAFYDCKRALIGFVPAKISFFPILIIMFKDHGRKNEKPFAIRWDENTTIRNGICFIFVYTKRGKLLKSPLK